MLERKSNDQVGDNILIYICGWWAWDHCGKRKGEMFAGDDDA